MSANKGQGMKWCSHVKRLAVYMRDGFACVYCGEGVEHDITLTIDHQVARMHGGKNDWKNLLTSCKNCNDYKGNKSLAEFLVRNFTAGGPRRTVYDRIRKFTARSKKKYMKLARKILANRSLKDEINGRKETSQAVR